jgi:6,7-dimethyl-8-ribityllumazine synthase
MTEKDNSARGFRFAIVLGKYNSFITERLLESAQDLLKLSGVAEENISIFKVPGCFEIPQMARRVAQTGEFNAIICLGALIRGKTLHFQLIGEECARGIQQVAAEFGLPLTFGVITAENMKQAVERSGKNPENRGREAAQAALDMAVLYHDLNAQQSNRPVATGVK